jgi:Tfp pilus assembly protein PilE
MSKEAKGQNLWGLIVIAAILSGLSFWTYNEVANDYLSVERSNKMVAALLENQTQVVRNYSHQVNDFKMNLAKAEEKIAQVETENTDLKGKLAALENVSALEQRIAELEASNAQLKQDMELAAAAAKSREDELNMKLQEFIAELDFKSVDEGRVILTKYKKKIREIKSRIKTFQIEDRNEEIAAFRSQDAARLSLGNNGYLIRNGEVTPVDVVWPPAVQRKNVNIDVTFVK